MCVRSQRDKGRVYRGKGQINSLSSCEPKRNKTHYFTGTEKRVVSSSKMHHAHAHLLHAEKCLPDGNTATKHKHCSTLFFSARRDGWVKGGRQETTGCVCVCGMQKRRYTSTQREHTMGSEQIETLVQAACHMRSAQLVAAALLLLLEGAGGIALPPLKNPGNACISKFSKV